MVQDDGQTERIVGTYDQVNDVVWLSLEDSSELTVFALDAAAPLQDGVAEVPDLAVGDTLTVEDEFGGAFAVEIRDSSFIDQYGEDLASTRFAFCHGT